MVSVKCFRNQMQFNSCVNNLLSLDFDSCLLIKTLPIVFMLVYEYCQNNNGNQIFLQGLSCS